MSNLQWKLDGELQPKLLQAKEDVQTHMEQITAAKQHYMAADKRCKDAEETIKRETEEARLLKEQLDAKFEEVEKSFHLLSHSLFLRTFIALCNYFSSSSPFLRCLHCIILH